MIRSPLNNSGSWVILRKWRTMDCKCKYCYYIYRIIQY